MAGVVSHWLVIMEADVQSQASPCGIYGGRSGTETGPSPSNSVFLCQYHSRISPYLSSSTFCSYEKDKRTKPGNVPKTMLFRKTGSI